MRIITSLLLWVMVISVIVAGCNNSDTKAGEAPGEERYYFDYLVTGEEGSDLVTCRFQFRLGGREGIAVALPDSGMVELDGEVLQADSTKFTGVYYEANKPVSTFRGSHSIVVNMGNGQKFREEFEFVPFNFETELPPVLSRRDQIFKLRDFPLNRTPLRIVMTDTAFGTSWINKSIAVINGEIPITTEMLARLKNGPIGLELHREERKQLKDKSSKGGRMVIRYSLKRELELGE